ncbi:Uncharacterised protein [Vibrio cholerae]|nr:Uncharacterised protein [Vibrio cholerae]CSI53266.1 Uncharacterised protein [Vibrio cholerae]
MSTLRSTGFRMKSSPSAKHFSNESRSSNTVRKMIGIWCFTNAWRISLAVTNPSLIGIITSSRITSGRISISRIASIACCPSSKVSMCDAMCAKINRHNSRLVPWSSTIITLTAISPYERFIRYRISY